MSKLRTIEGPLHSIKVKEVSARTLAKHFAEAGEIVDGAYVDAENMIYILKTASDEAKIHTVLHELYHAFETHSVRMDSEGKADLFAAMLMRLFKVKTIEELYGNK